MPGGGSALFRDDLLDGQVALISGAGSGIGRATSIEFSRLGATVVGCGRSPEKLEETAALCPEGRFDAIACDVREEDQVEALVDGALERHERIDVLFNNAGGQFMAPAETVSMKGWRTILRLNLESVWLMTSTVANKAMIPQQSGKIIRITGSPHNGFPLMAHGGAARAGEENLMRGLAVEWARYGIRCLSVACGPVLTETFKGKYPIDVQRAMHSQTPLGRAGTEEEVAWMIAFLASPGGDWHTGSVITMDGGMDCYRGAFPPKEYADEQARTEERKA